jgi:predicted ArsR family transcriptional regulator
MPDTESDLIKMLRRHFPNTASVTAASAATALDLTPGTIRNMLIEGVLPCIKFHTGKGKTGRPKRLIDLTRHDELVE